jgi:hypothetical protein
MGGESTAIPAVLAILSIVLPRDADFGPLPCLSPYTFSKQYSSIFFSILLNSLEVPGIPS